MSNKINEIPLPEKLDKSKKNLIIFDDCLNLLNQSVISSFYSQGRHSSCIAIYLSQSFFDLHRTVRLNSNYIILFKLSQRNLNDVYNSAVGTIMDKNKFMTMAQNTFSKKYSYLAINKEEDKILTDIFTEEEESSEDDE